MNQQKTDRTPVCSTALTAGGLCCFLCSLLAAGLLLGQPVYGGALYLCCAAGAAFFSACVKNRGQLPAAGERRALQAQLMQANAYRVYRPLCAATVIALELSLALPFTALALSSAQPVAHTAAAAAAVLLSCAAAVCALRWRQRKRRRASEPTNILLLGLLLWLAGLVWAWCGLGHGIGWVSLLAAFGLCGAGAGLCAACLNWLESEMVQVARFAAEGDVSAYGGLRAASLRLSRLAGRGAALALLALLCFLLPRRADAPWAEYSPGFTAMLLLPPLLAVLCAVGCAFNFPLSVRMLEKLSRLLGIRDRGEDNEALAAQLRQRVVEPCRMPYATNCLKVIIRNLYRHQVQGTEHIRPDEDDPLVFLCNHGDMYGPVISQCYLPLPVRTWSMSTLMVDRDEATAYIYKYNFENNAAVPKCMRHFLARTLARVSMWGLRQLECLPVYRDKPTQLMRTFRTSVEAMQAGDNLLIFPENPNALGQDHGYESQGLGELFSGFTMLAPIYYNRTGKRCRFLPMFADKQRRLVSFGTEVLFDPDNDSHDESLRIVQEVRAQMLAMAGLSGE